MRGCSKRLLKLTLFQRYIIKRILYAFVTIFVIVYFVFAISRSAGDPVSAYITEETPLEEMVDLIKAKYHLDEPIPVQFVYWLKGIFRGDWGRSHSRGKEPIAELIPRYIPITVELNLWAFALSIPLAYWIGTKAAIKKDTWIDHFARILAIVGQAVPSFFIALLLLLFLYPRGWMVISPIWTFKKITGMPTIDALLNGDLGGFILAFKYLIGPLLTSFISSLSMKTRLLRSSILEELGKDYIMTGKAKGLSKDYIDKKYARRNALIPFVTVVGLWMGSIISGSTITEVVFARYGLGMVSAEAAKIADHNALQAYVMIYSIVLVITNLFVDIIYGFIDPRIKYGEIK